MGENLMGENLVYEKSNVSMSSNHSSSSNSSNNSEVNYSDDEDEDEDAESDESNSDDEDYEDEGPESDDTNDDEDDADDDESEECEEEQVFAYIHNFPTQLICLEKCDGTMDRLFEKGQIDEIEGASALFQVVMTLLVYQKAFHFTHNDLHTNNIMYINTDIEYLIYRYEGKHYKIPTYGKIYKIIDFGRSIYKYKNQLFCSDSFATGGDASTQYNFEPYMNKNKPRLEPNYSFDLCRLGCSIYDFILEDESEDEMDEFQELIYHWCLDDNDKNVLYKRNGDERYPNFKLYKMIARTVHDHIPAEQFKRPFFNQFEMTSKQIKKYTGDVINIDDIPVYI